MIFSVFKKKKVDKEEQLAEDITRMEMQKGNLDAQLTKQKKFNDLQDKHAKLKEEIKRKREEVAMNKVRQSPLGKVYEVGHKIAKDVQAQAKKMPASSPFESSAMKAFSDMFEAPKQSKPKKKKQGSPFDSEWF